MTETAAQGTTPTESYGNFGLTPAVVMTVAEAAMWRHNPQVAAYLASGDFDGEEIDLDAS
jgi:hypothetical protein